MEFDLGKAVFKVPLEIKQMVFYSNTFKHRQPNFWNDYNVFSYESVITQILFIPSKDLQSLDHD